MIEYAKDLWRRAERALQTAKTLTHAGDHDAAASRPNTPLSMPSARCLRLKERHSESTPPWKQRFTKIWSSQVAGQPSSEPTTGFPERFGALVPTAGCSTSPRRRSKARSAQPAGSSSQPRRLVGNWDKATSHRNRETTQTTRSDETGASVFARASLSGCYLLPLARALVVMYA